MFGITKNVSQERVALRVEVDGSETGKIGRAVGLDRSRALKARWDLEEVPC